MKQNTKTNEQLYEELEQALHNLSEKLSDLLNNGTYKFEDISRDFKTNRVDFAIMNVGKHRLVLKIDDNHDGTTVEVALPENPVNQTMLDAWDRQTIDSDIAYHQRKLDALKKLKEEQDKP